MCCPELPETLGGRSTGRGATQFREVVCSDRLLLSRIAICSNVALREMKRQCNLFFDVTGI